MRAVVDPTLCQSQGRCYNSFPDLFERGRDGKGVASAIDNMEVDDDIRFDLQNAANQCPRGAIRIED